jgi:signal transduction histidine kinase/CheY-like chemotaxis protein
LTESDGTEGVRMPRGQSPLRIVGRWWLDRSVLAKGLTVVAIPVGALIAVACAGIVLQSQERAERREAMSANALVRASTAVLSDAVDAETGMRGYAATGDRLFLRPYEAAVARVDDDVGALRRAADARGEGARAGSVAATTTEVFDRLAEVRAAVEAGRLGPDLLDGLTAAKAAVDRLRGQIADLADPPQRLVAEKRESISRLETTIQWVQLGGLALGILASLAGVSLFTAGISRRLRLAADNANRLGLGEPLRPVSISDDELGQLGRSLTRAQRLLDARLSELVETRDRAVLATQTKTTFLSRTSHELRTPLNAILGFAQLLEMSDLNEDDRDGVARIISAGKHLLALINELIDIARVEAGELKLSLEPVPLQALADEVATLMTPLAAARGVTIQQRCARDGLAAHADHLRLRQVVVNLASNAVKYNHFGGVITIACGPHGADDVEIAITDSGTGLSPDEIERIFVPFERLEAEQHGIEGTGIGLPLALALTEAMHGTLTVESTPGRGSTFAVRLPRAATAPSAGGFPESGQHGEHVETGARSPIGRAVGVGAISVLSIEDNPVNCELLVRVLQRWPDTHLETATSGHAGIAKATRNPPDLILLDLHLPDLAGEEVFARLRAEPATQAVPIVVLSADASPGTIRRLLARGAAAYLTKPLNLSEFADVVERTVRERRGELNDPSGPSPHEPDGGFDVRHGALRRGQ